MSVGIVLHSHPVLVCYLLIRIKDRVHTMTKPRWYQFSLRSLVLLITACCLPLGWLAYERNEVQKREQLIRDLEAVGGYATFDESQPFRPAWMRPLLGPHYLGEVVGMNFVGGEVDHDHLDRMASLTMLESLTLTDCPVTDFEMPHLAGLEELQTLALDGTRVTDAGLIHLAGLPKLKLLWLSNTGITDAGLAHLQGLHLLESLSLDGTRVTDVGLVHLAGLSELQGLDLSGTKITDEGLPQLAVLQNLRILNLNGTQITDAGLVHLSGLSNLTDHYLGGTKVTDEGYRDLKEKLPGTRILR